MLNSPTRPEVCNSTSWQGVRKIAICWCCWPHVVVSRYSQIITCLRKKWPPLLGIFISTLFTLPVTFSSAGFLPFQFTLLNFFVVSQDLFRLKCLIFFLRPLTKSSDAKKSLSLLPLK